MDLQSSSKRVLGDLKSRFGIGRRADEQADEFYDDYEEYDETLDYGEYGYDESYAYEDDGYSARMGSVTTRTTSPRLVSIDDVRATTQVPTFPDSPATRSSSGSYRTMVDSSLPPQMTPEGTAAASAAASAAYVSRSVGGDRHDRSDRADSPRSEGLNSLFEPTASYDSSSRSYSGSRFASGRSVQTVIPTSYEDAEKITKALKVGDAVVLSVTAVPADLMKRILDFSFGAASALDANVECIAPKVFAVTRGSALTENERAGLQSRGIL